MKLGGTFSIAQDMVKVLLNVGRYDEGSSRTILRKMFNNVWKVTEL